MSDRASSSIASSPTGPRDVAQVLGVLYQLALEAIRCDSRQALIFTILNQSHQLLPYDRAFLFEVHDHEAKILGISGIEEVDANAERVTKTRALVAAIRDPSSAILVSNSTGDIPSLLWQELEKETKGLSAIWLPWRTSIGWVGLWLERWGGATWLEAELSLLTNLAEVYGATWAREERSWQWRHLLPHGRRRRGFLVGMAILLFYLFFLHRFPLRVVAPCEVIPDLPWVAAAPLDGVIQRVLVEPGERVQIGTPLYVYDTRVTEQDLEVVRRQVRVIEAQLERARSLAFRDNAALADVAVLEERRRQELLRLELAEENLRRQTVRSEVEGVAMVENPEAWRGRPVRTGERVLSVLHPERTRVRIWVAEEDNLDGIEAHPARIFLHIAPDRSKTARITYISPATAESPTGVNSFVVEAIWAEGESSAKIGLRGTAMLYGEKSSLAYFLLRKPWTWLRRTFGI